MKNSIIIKNIIKSLLVVVFLFGSMSFAGEKWWEDVLEIKKSDPTKWKDYNGDTYENSYRWSLRIKPFPQEANPIFVYKPAKLEWDCNGVSFESAFLQYIGFKDIEMMLKHASVSFFWGMILALKITLPKIDAVFKAIRKMAQNIRDLLANACQIGKQFINDNAPGAIAASRRVQGMVKGFEKYIDNMASPINAAADRIEKWHTSLITPKDKKGAASEVGNAAFFDVFRRSNGSIFNAMFAKYNYCDSSNKEGVGLWTSTLGDMLYVLSQGDGTLKTQQVRNLYIDPNAKAGMPSGSTTMGDGVLNLRTFVRVDSPVDASACRMISTIEKIKLKRKVFIYKIFFFLVGDNGVNESFINKLYSVTNSIDALKQYMKNLQAGNMAADILSTGSPAVSIQGHLSGADFQKFVEYGAKASNCMTYGQDKHDPTSNTCFVPDLETIIYNLKGNKDSSLKGPRIRGTMLAVPKEDAVATGNVIELMWDGFEAVAYRSVQYMVCSELNASLKLGSPLSKRLMQDLISEYEKIAANKSPSMANGNKVFTTCNAMLQLGHDEWQNPTYIFMNAIGMYPRIKKYLKNLSLLLKAREENVQSVARLADSLSGRLQLIMSIDFLENLSSIIYVALDSEAFSVLSVSASDKLYKKKSKLDEIITKAKKSFIKKREDKITKDGPFYVEYKRVADAVRRVRTQRTIIQGQ